MVIAQKFLGLDQPALTQAADYLIDRFRRQHTADLGGVTVVLPGGRAGRRLLELLVDKCAALELLFTPPQITTVGQLPELLYQAKRPFADELTQKLTWSNALQQVDPKKLDLLLATVPKFTDTHFWFDFAGVLQALHRELASDGLGFPDVVKAGATLPGFSETDRWKILAEIQAKYLATLDNLKLWDRQTARLVAIKEQECTAQQPIVLIAAADLNRAIRQMLTQVANQVTTLIYAPEDWSERFDSHGCLIARSWEAVELNIPDEAIISAEKPQDQAEAVLRCIAEFDGRFSAEQITIGVPDERIVPSLTRQLNEHKLPNRFGPGEALSRSGVFRLLHDLAKLLESKDFTYLAAFVRHPDIEDWLLKLNVPPGWIEELDHYYQRHLPSRWSEGWLGPNEKSQSLRSVHALVKQLLAPLVGPSQTLLQWQPKINKLIQEVYGDRCFDLENKVDRKAWKSIGIIQETLRELKGIPDQLIPELPAWEAIQLLLSQVRSQQLAPPATDSCIELVGWLELPLDDAPALIVTNFNEGTVPSSLNADLFLPGKMRSLLGLDDNTRRYARDAYAVSTLLVTWRKTSLIIGRRDLEDNPLTPSRLVFATGSSLIAERTRTLFQEASLGKGKAPLVGQWHTTGSEANFKVPKPQPLSEPITRLSVTSFKSYLSCPYRFYLERILGLRAKRDDATELDGATFGNLAHQVLERFGKSEVNCSDNADDIRVALNQFLEDRVRQQFGKHLRTAILIQAEQLRRRLHAFAVWQAERTRLGWRIEYTEQSFSDSPASFEVDDQQMLLTGRIDRIDVHEETGERQILDYKTSDAGSNPEKNHREKKSGAWTDLQLPLYRHLVRQIGICDPIRLGYMLLPKSNEAIGLALADWSEADLQDADATARDVIRNIRRERFWPPTEPAPKYSDDYAYICMDGVFGRPSQK